MMHNIVDQIDGAWTAASPLHSGDVRVHDNAKGEPREGCNGQNGHAEHRSAGSRAIVTARDFMVLRIPSHELSEAEREDVESTVQEARQVTEEWSRTGGVWVEHEKRRSWIGHGPAPREGTV